MPAVNLNISMARFTMTAIGWARGARAGTPEAIIARLHKEISAMQDLPAIQQQIANDYMDSETAKWGRVIRQAGIKPQ